ncbi:MAG: PD-(D/E)XK nuclease family protein, partial [Planctomycetota bacterium]
MPRKRIKQFQAWSFSRKRDYDECPLRAKLKHLDRIPEEEGDALIRGSEIHGKAERYATGEIRKMPEELKLFDEEFRALRKIKKRLEVEQSWAVDRKWVTCEWNDWDRCWLRLKIDVAYTEKRGAHLEIIDHKTGRVRPNVEQLDLYAAAAPSRFPKAKTITASFWYLDWGEIVTRKYTIDEALKLRKQFEKSIKPMFADKVFKPRPGNACRW